MLWHRSLDEMMRQGLSPRGRGNPDHLAFVVGASAGAVYPRVGGETLDMRWLAGSIEGLSPRGRGNRRGADVQKDVMRL